MGYYDGNTVTALWNYAQHYAMSDHSFGTTFGPSTPGALNLISGQTNGAVIDQLNARRQPLSPTAAAGLTLISDADPTGDLCSSTSSSVQHDGQEHRRPAQRRQDSPGASLKAASISPSPTPTARPAARAAPPPSITGKPSKADYIPHHQPFQYYASTANPNHTRPTSVAAIGTNADAANHQYDIHDFTDALAAGNLPAVSFLKAPGFQDGHAGYSDPLDEQTFVVNTINAIEKSSPSGPAPPSSSPTTTPTAGMTTCRTSSTAPPPPADTFNGAGVCISATLGAQRACRASTRYRCTPRAAAATVRVCPCWLSLPGPRRIHRLHRHRSELHHALYRRHLPLAASALAAAPSIASPVAHQHVRLLNGAVPPTPTSSCSTLQPARSPAATEPKRSQNRSHSLL